MKEKEPNKLSGLIIPILVAFFNVLIILFPSDILSAAREGLSLWFNNVMPSLLPFVVGTNILTGLGFVSFLGTLLEPVMAPLFGVPGCGGYALVTGMTSGYPIGAKTVTLLREKNELSQVEAQRLIAFCNNSGPLFMLGAVGVGMFKSAQAGYFLMLCHYISAVLTGLVFKYYKPAQTKKSVRHSRLFRQALRNMHAARQKDGRSFGQVLGDSMKNAMETIAVVGGFIVLFCVIVKIFEVTDFIYIIEKICAPVITYLGIDNGLFEGLFVGIIEVTNGSRILSLSSLSKAQMLITVAIVSFGGLSIFAQTVSIINTTDIKQSVYFVSKVIHSILSVLVAQLLFPFFNFATEESTAVLAYLTQQNQVLEKLAYSSFMFLFSLTAIAIVIFGFNSLRLIKNKRD